MRTKLLDRMRHVTWGKTVGWANRKKCPGCPYCQPEQPEEADEEREECQDEN